MLPASLSAVIDPSLLVFRFPNWRDGSDDWDERRDALVQHVSVLRRFQVPCIATVDFLNVVLSRQPWAESIDRMPELRDLRLFVTGELAKANFIEPRDLGPLSVSPVDSMCRHVEGDMELIRSWHELLSAVLDEPIVLALWPSSACAGSCLIHVEAPEAGVSRTVPGVSDEESWAATIPSFVDYWPDLERLVDLECMATPALRTARMVSTMRLRLLDGFLDSVIGAGVDAATRGALVRVVAKRLCGVVDAGMGNEKVGAFWRMRASDYWRIHYELDGDELVLRRFGPHRLEGIG